MHVITYNGKKYGRCYGHENEAKAAFKVLNACLLNLKLETPS